MSCDALTYLAILLFDAICLSVYTMALTSAGFPDGIEEHLEVGVNWTDHHMRNDLNISIAFFFVISKLDDW